MEKPMSEPMKMSDLGTKFKYFEYKDLPARWQSRESTPEVYRYGKGWEPVDSSWDFMHSYIPVDEARIKEMIANLEGKGPPAD
jgi:hypothetical protein